MALRHSIRAIAFVGRGPNFLNTGGTILEELSTVNIFSSAIEVPVFSAASKSPGFGPKPRRWKYLATKARSEITYPVNQREPLDIRCAHEFT